MRSERRRKKTERRFPLGFFAMHRFIPFDASSLSPLCCCSLLFFLLSTA